MISPPLPGQMLRDIDSYCKMWRARYDLFTLQGRYYWAIIGEDEEPMMLGRDMGYANATLAIRDAWRHLWPGREVRCK